MSDINLVGDGNSLKSCIRCLSCVSGLKLNRTNVRAEKIFKVAWHTEVVNKFVVSVLPLARFLASMFSILSCFPPFSLIPHTTLLSETHLAHQIVFFP